jgi:hypothetical protein
MEPDISSLMLSMVEGIGSRKFTDAGSNALLDIVWFPFAPPILPLSKLEVILFDKVRELFVGETGNRRSNGVLQM